VYYRLTVISKHLRKKRKYYDECVSKKIKNNKYQIKYVCKYYEISQTQPKLLNNLSKHRKPPMRLIKDALTRKKNI